jgi:predicted RNA-binding Zn-ribbon protein involved in translation (DUF1610 family)
MFNFFKKTKTLKDDLFSFKNEPLTSLSIFFLIILDIFIFTNISIGINAETSKSPKPYIHYPSTCSNHFLDPKESYSSFYTRSVTYNRHNTNELCTKLFTHIDKITRLDEFKHNKSEQEKLNRQLSSNNTSIEKISKKYNTQLFEKIASVGLDNELQQVQQRYRYLQEQNKEIQTKLDAIPSVTTLSGYKEYKDFVELHKEKYKTKSEDYKFWQPFYEYGHLLVFTLPILIISILVYANIKRKELNSKEYNPVIKIISVHISVLLSLPLIFYTLNLVYHVIPKTLLKNLIEFLYEIGLISILNYLTIFIAVLVFGYIIYFLQKRSAKNRTLSIDKNKQKHIAMSKCPKCLNRVDFSKPYCPHCANELLVECQNCHKETIKGLNFCHHCSSAI